MPRLVRREPLAERIKAYLDPWDWLMWASEELNSNDWDDFAKSYASSLGLAMNVFFMVARANSSRPSPTGDDVFGDYQRKSSGWLSSIMNFVVLSLSILSFLNAFYTFFRKRHYRLFEQPIETNPSTPSAHRVHVDSSPLSSSPFRFLLNFIASTSAESRAHPDAARDVWEIAVWDPNPLCLQLFCLFSPLHVILYYFNLPVAPLDPQPSVKVVTTVIIGGILTAQMLYLQISFSQQAKDSAIIHREVLHEYDTKFVHPILQKPCRDVGIQTIPKPRTRDSGPGRTELASEVDTFTPTTVINRGFRTNPNQAYSSQYDPNNLGSIPNTRPTGSSTQTPSLRPTQNGSYVPSSVATTGTDFSSPIRQSNTPNPFRQPQFRPAQVGNGDGGSLGVYTHAASPLRKAASTNFLRDERSRGRESLGGAGEKRREGSSTKREGSPLKRMSTPGGFTGGDGGASVVPDRFSKRYAGLGAGRRESGQF
ncbi:uncharacterized protein BDR25DRAFT_339847 [Lindgomyces ingoldianus]|uniref:Uncharacterized protein n=1 Tax=Lindgomyces ingoldianus TaxID=673940 RepID=A0ACB6RBI7_9PLEO|nr:uncharacterized protein BDR25DRAFT_339847 [Lindgomyces ingoldianus]KAF2475887.1 hypothetical protein BDR25DRAFT_339847 [Lindgomyces ingoldianus]